MKNIYLIFFISIIMISCIKQSKNNIEPENQQIHFIEEIRNVLVDETAEVGNPISQDNILKYTNFEKHENITGLYYVNSFEIITRENVYSVGYYINLLGFDNVTESNIVDNDNIYFEIQEINDNTFLLNYNFPFYGSRNPKFNNIQFQLPVINDNPICSLEADRGLGGSYLEFYLIDDYVLLNFFCYQYNEDEKNLKYNYKTELKCEFIFKKRNEYNKEI